MYILKMNLCVEKHYEKYLVSAVYMYNEYVIGEGILICVVEVMKGEYSCRDILFVYQVGASVRCLHWWGESRVLIGCLDGRVCDWNIEEQNVKEMCRIRGSVIVIRSNHIRKVRSYRLFIA